MDKISSECGNVRRSNRIDSQNDKWLSLRFDSIEMNISIWFSREFEFAPPLVRKQFVARLSVADSLIVIRKWYDDTLSPSNAALENDVKIVRLFQLFFLFSLFASRTFRWRLIWPVKTYKFQKNVIGMNSRHWNCKTIFILFFMFFRFRFDFVSFSSTYVTSPAMPNRSNTKLSSDGKKTDRTRKRKASKENAKSQKQRSDCERMKATEKGTSEERMAKEHGKKRCNRVWKILIAASIKVCKWRHHRHTHHQERLVYLLLLSSLLFIGTKEPRPSENRQRKRARTHTWRLREQTNGRFKKKLYFFLTRHSFYSSDSFVIFIASVRVFSKHASQMHRWRNCAIKLFASFSFVVFLSGRSSMLSLLCFARFGRIKPSFRRMTRVENFLNAKRNRNLQWNELLCVWEFRVQKGRFWRIWNSNCDNRRRKLFFSLSFRQSIRITRNIFD